jgi:hypothetical protein
MPVRPTDENSLIACLGMVLHPHFQTVNVKHLAVTIRANHFCCVFLGEWGQRVQGAKSAKVSRCIRRDMMRNPRNLREKSSGMPETPRLNWAAEPMRTLS